MSDDFVNNQSKVQDMYVLCALHGLMPQRGEVYPSERTVNEAAYDLRISQEKVRESVARLLEADLIGYPPLALLRSAYQEI
jgi:hypothetical protein